MVKVTEQAVNHLETANSNVSRNGYITVAVGLGDRLAIKLVDPNERTRDRVVMTRYIGNHVKYRLVLKDGDRIRVTKNETTAPFGAMLVKSEEYEYKIRAFRLVGLSAIDDGFVTITADTVNTACVYTYIGLQDCLFGDSFPSRVIVSGIGVPRVTFILTPEKELPEKLNPHDFYFGLKLTDDGWTSEFIKLEDGYKDFDIVVTPMQKRGMINTYAYNEETQERFKWLLKAKAKATGIHSTISENTSGAQLFFKPLVTE